MMQSKTTIQHKRAEEQKGTSGARALRSMQAVPVLQKAAPNEELLQKKPNNTGLPDNLKSGVENLSGFSMDDVKVHYNSDKPAQLQALAYAQGTDIHVAPAQEKHLPHEAWHVVQQKQGRVQPTMQMKEGVAVNDDKGLEHEADVMGEKAVQTIQTKQSTPKSLGHRINVIQRIGDKIAMGYEDVSKMGEEIKGIRSEVEKIYTNYKATKKDKMNTLDKEFIQKTDKLEERQKYLINAIQFILYELVMSGDGNSNFLEEYDNLDIVMVNSELPDMMKYDLLSQGRSIAFQLINNIENKMIQRPPDKPKEKELKQIIHNVSRPYGRHAIADPIVQGYEKGYKETAMDRKVLITEWKEFANKKGYNLLVETKEKNIENITIAKRSETGIAKGSETGIHIATIYFDEQRFQKILDGDITLPDGEKRERFRHRESGVEYVQDAKDIFVKRYVKRALNKNDNPEDKSRGVEINADPRKKKGGGTTWAQIAKLIPNMDIEKRDKEILNHQRYKEQQGGSPFVSFTTTDRPIFGSSGKLFESDEGVATVDLAKISKSRIFDTHTTEAMARIHGKDPDPTMPYAEGDERFEKNSAARDAMRTRELVVAGGIPDEAIVEVTDKLSPYLKGRKGKFQPPEEVIASYLERPKRQPWLGLDYYLKFRRNIKLNNQQDE
jgi:hypothetical protein